MIRSLGLAVISFQLLCTNAIGICGPGLVNTIFHAGNQENVEASSVLDVIIVRTIDMKSDNAFVVVAKVKRVIKGPSIKGGEITISTPYDDCFLRALPGEDGIVVGNIQIDEKGDAQLIAIAERLWKKRVFDSQRR